MKKVIKILIVAGEPSGDALASKVIKSIKDNAEVELYGTGGPMLLELGQKQIADVSDMTVIGFDSVIKKLPFLLSLSNKLIRQCNQVRPDIILLVDYGGFNLKFAKKIKKLFPDIPLVCLAAPQVWVWNESRVTILKDFFDLVLCLLPFEERFLKDRGVNAVYIGNPIIENISYKSKSKVDFCERFNFNPQKPIIGIIPGSRVREIMQLTPVIKDAVKALNGVQFVIAKAKPVGKDTYAALSGGDIKVVEDATYDIMRYSDLLWVCSGTATLEAAVIGTPMIILYTSSWFNFFIIQRLTKLRMVGLPNIISNMMNLNGQTPIMPELLYKDCTAHNLLSTYKRVIECLPDYQKRLKPVSDLFKYGQPSKAASYEILKLLQDKV